jgi:cytochrome c biogenesis protein CcdA
MPAAPAATPPLAFMAALLGALLGGLILNLMPCVFPVLAIKVLGFSRMPRRRPARTHRSAGLAYTAGVVLSFVALAALLLGLRAAGEAAGLGLPAAVAAGGGGAGGAVHPDRPEPGGLFEFGSVLPSSVASLQARHPVADAFLTGVLAVAVASPCTAPFMGASLGLARPRCRPRRPWRSLPRWAWAWRCPTWLASWVPAVARLLPRPGCMDGHLPPLMAFPMFATVVWLVWVLGQQTGIDGAAALLAAAGGAGVRCWAGRSRSGPHAAGTCYRGPGAGLAVLTCGCRPMAPNRRPRAPVRGDRLAALDARPGGAARGHGPAGVCRLHRRLVRDLPVQQEDHAGQRRRAGRPGGQATCPAARRLDPARPAITAALAQLGRNGVPVYVFYKPAQGPGGAVEILGVEEVRSVDFQTVGVPTMIRRRLLPYPPVLALAAGNAHASRRRGPAARPTSP